MPRTTTHFRLRDNSPNSQLASNRAEVVLASLQLVAGSQPNEPCRAKDLSIGAGGLQCSGGVLTIGGVLVNDAACGFEDLVFTGGMHQRDLIGRGTLKERKMNQRPIVHHNTYCHHEAGHAVAFWHFGIEIEYVRITPDNPRHTGETKTVPHELSSLAEIEAEMQCAAAGEIAASMLSSLREDPADTELIEGFKRNASRVAADPGLTSADGDGPWFAKVGLQRDEICRAMPGADTGPER